MRGIALLIVLGFAAPALAVPTVWLPANGGNGHIYDVIAVPSGITWTNARSAAIAAGGDLASITSAAENNFVFSLTDSTTYWYTFDSANSIGPWIGGFQPGGSPEPAGGYQWVSGEPFVFTNWSIGQPDNFSGEDRVHYHLTGVGRAATWNDLQNAGGVLPHAYVIETVPEPTSLAASVAGVLLLIRRPRPRKRASCAQG